MTPFKTRRWDGFPVLFAGLLTVGLILAALANWPNSAAGNAILASMEAVGLAAAYLMGPVAYVRSSADNLIVGNEIMRHVIPAQSIRAVGGYDNLGVDVELEDGRRVPVRAFEPSISPLARTRRGYAAKGRALEKALEEFATVRPGSDGGMEYRRKLRLDSLVAIAVILLASATAIANLRNA